MMGLLQHRAGVPPDAFCGGLALGKVKGGGEQARSWMAEPHAQSPPGSQGRLSGLCSAPESKSTKQYGPKPSTLQHS